ncbi:MAG: SDR family oxidoreductase [Gammaproteobacteria bacterium]|nr:SDR family oxidoreductase [Gammaproteobacteria bacterium]
MLAGRIALVTGAGRGIGRGIAEAFAAAGATVMLAARTQTDLRDCAQAIEHAGGRAAWQCADVGDAAACTALVEHTVATLGALDILVHNAGIFPMSPIEAMSDADWNRVLDVNLGSAFRLTRASIPHLRARGGGRLLFTSSVTGNRVAAPGCAHYAASKAGMNGFIRSAALELAADRITVNGVEPGLVLTPGAAAVTDDAIRAAMAGFVPLKRWGEPADIAGAMLYLASDAAAYVTGQTIVVDGGALLPENGAMMLDDSHG